jgi:hypothetical protein
MKATRVVRRRMFTLDLVPRRLADRAVRRRFLLGVAVVLGICTLTACGGGTGSGASSSVSAPAATPSPSPSTDATTAYRRVLSQGNDLLNSDVDSYLSSCNFGIAPYKDSCRQWALMDEALVTQFVGLLSNAQVPAADASDDQLLRQGLQMLVADDTAAANAIGSGNEAAATRALGKRLTDHCTAVSPVLSKLDPGVHGPSGC